MSETLATLATAVGATLAGDGDCVIERVDSLQDANAGAIGFLSDSRYREYLAGTRASAVILSEDDLEACPVNALVTDNPHLAFARIAALLNPPADARPGVHPSAVVEAGSKIDPGACVGPLTYIGAGVVIAAGATIGPQCVLDGDVSIGVGTRLVASVNVIGRVRIGARCLLHPGAVVGSDGFGLAKDRDAWVKVPQLGGVRIGDDVEIGSNTTVDRGAIKDTVIDDGVKLDNQIQIAHNVEIGKHTAMAAFVGVSGSTKIGSRCTIGGQSGFAGHLQIVDDVHLTGATAVAGDITEPGVYSGAPAVPNNVWCRNTIRFKQLDTMAKRLRALERRFEELQGD